MIPCVWGSPCPADSPVSAVIWLFSSLTAGQTSSVVSHLFHWDAVGRETSGGPAGSVHSWASAGMLSVRGLNSPSAWEQSRTRDKEWEQFWNVSIRRNDSFNHFSSKNLTSVTDSEMKHSEQEQDQTAASLKRGPCLKLSRLFFINRKIIYQRKKG